MGGDDDEPSAAGPNGPTGGGRESGAMALYVIERSFLDGLDPDALDDDHIRAINDEVGVRWILSFLSADHRKTYCLYEAPNPESIREAAARLGIPADAVVAVEEIGPEAGSFLSSSSSGDRHRTRQGAP